MATFSQYIAAQPHKTHEEWAEHFGMSRSHFSECLRGIHIPSAKLMVRIQQRTGGHVTPSDWMGEGAEDAA